MNRLVEEQFAKGSPEALLAHIVRTAGPPLPSTLRPPLAAVYRPGRPRTRRLVVHMLIAVGLTVTSAVLASTLARQRFRAMFVHAPVAQTSLGLAAQVKPVEGPTAVDSPDESAAASAAAGEALLPRAPPVNPQTPGRSVRRTNDSDDVADVLQAIRLLRTEHDAAGASQLLSKYLNAHPRGVVAEDAFALAIEAADRRHDARMVSDYANRYLRQYPAGRFRLLAIQATQRTAALDPKASDGGI